MNPKVNIFYELLIMIMKHLLWTNNHHFFFVFMTCSSKNKIKTIWGKNSHHTFMQIMYRLMKHHLHQLLVYSISCILMEKRQLLVMTRFHLISLWFLLASDKSVAMISLRINMHVRWMYCDLVLRYGEAEHIQRWNWRCVTTFFKQG